MLNLCEVLESCARKDPDGVAVYFEESSCSFAELDASASRFANALLEAGVGHGDRVALVCTTNPWFPVAFFGILKVGAIATPLNPLLSADDMQYCLEQSGASVLVCEDGTPELPIGRNGRTAFERVDACRHYWRIPSSGSSVQVEGEDVAALLERVNDSYTGMATTPNDIAVLIYTSGTTGRPKGAALSHANLLLNSMLVAKHLAYTSEDILVVSVPMYHSMGLVVLMSAGFYEGASLHMQRRFVPQQVLDAFASGKGTFFCGVPTMYQLLLGVEQSEADIEAVARNWRLACCGGSPVPATIIESMLERYNTPITIGYGLSETSPIVSMTTAGDTRPCCVGKPLWGIQVEIRNPSGDRVAPGERGEICVRGHNVMSGYYRAQEATDAAFQDGYFRTGDIGYLDKEGALYVMDRCKDMIIRGGNNIYPAEVEQALLRHPDIQMCAVIGRPDDLLGEEIEAVIQLTTGSSVSERDLQAWCREHVSGHSYPRIITLRTELPLGPTGKVLKRKLRESV